MSSRMASRVSSGLADEVVGADKASRALVRVEQMDVDILIMMREDREEVEEEDDKWVAGMNCLEQR